MAAPSPTSPIAPPAEEPAGGVVEPEPATTPQVRPGFTTPVATPCRSSEAASKEPVAAGGLQEIPLLGEAATAPKVGELRLSENAINLRLRRVFQPNTRTGQFRVADNIRNLYHDKKNKNGREKLLQIFQSCGFDSDCVMSNS